MTGEPKLLTCSVCGQFLHAHTLCREYLQTESIERMDIPVEYLEKNRGFNMSLFECVGGDDDNDPVALNVVILDHFRQQRK